MKVAAEPGGSVPGSVVFAMEKEAWLSFVYLLVVAFPPQQLQQQRTEQLTEPLLLQRADGSTSLFPEIT